MRTRTTSILAAAALALGATAVACSSDSGNQSSSNTTAANTGTTGVTLDDTSRLAAAKTAAVQFFEAQAVNAYNKALEASTDAAATTITWAQGVNSVEAAQNTPYIVPTVQAPNVRVQIDHLEPSGTDSYRAVGFVELGQRPGPIGSTSTSTSTSSPGQATPPVTYVTDLDFKQSGSDVNLSDYRLDDTPYPVSQLFMTLDSTADGQGIDAKATLAHRDLDGSVQYLLTTKGDNGTLKEANFVQGTPGTTRPPSTGLPTSGTPATVYADAPDADDSPDALVVRPGAFPGSAGTLLLGFGDSADPASTVTLDLVLPDWPALTARPVNTVRDAQAGGTSTSSSSSSSSSTTSSSTSTSTSTSTPASSTTTSTTRPPSSTTSQSTTTSSSTTTTTAGLTGGAGNGY